MSKTFEVLSTGPNDLQVQNIVSPVDILPVQVLVIAKWALY